MENKFQIMPYNENNISSDSLNKQPSNKLSNFNSLNQISSNSKIIQTNIFSLNNVKSSRNLRQQKIQLNNKKKNMNINNLKRSETTIDLNLKYTENRDNTFHLNNNNKSTFATKDSNENNKNLETQDKKTGDDKVVLEEENIKRKKNGRNILVNVPKIKKQTFDINTSGYTDKSIKNWNELKQNYIEHVNNQKILKKYEKQKTDKTLFNNFKKFYFRRKDIDGIPYYYDITSTYMNKYQNKSEQSRHEILINELCKLRAYLSKYKIKNNLDIIKDFLIKYNIPNLNKYTNFQLMQFGRFVCQKDIYKINSLLKPYMHIKDMINDILQNSEDLNEKFTSFNINPSIFGFLENSKNNKNQKFIIRNIKTPKIDNVKNNLPKKNKKFYISELDYSMNQKDDKNDSILNQNINDNNNKEQENSEEEKNIYEKAQKDFKLFSLKRKEILKNIGIPRKKIFKNIEEKDSYNSPLFNRKKNKNIKQINFKKIKLPKISNNLGAFYKPNKLLLSPDKNYSLNFALLYKDVTNELNNFQNDYESKFNVDFTKKLNKNLHSKSCEFQNKSKNKNQRTLKDKNRLYYGKNTIKVDFDEIQKKHKLTEYIALLNAKDHIKKEIINNDILI